MDYTTLTDEKLFEIIESRYGNSLKKWDKKDPAVVEFFARIEVKR